MLPLNRLISLPKKKPTQRLLKFTLSDTFGKTIQCDWLLCSSDFRDIILIPSNLDEIDIDDQCTFEQPSICLFL